MTYPESQADYYDKTFTAAPYQTVLETIENKQEGESLYITESGLTVVGRIMSIIATVLGWLGFGNPTDPIQVDGELLKFLYHGSTHHWMSTQTIRDIVERIHSKIIRGDLNVSTVAKKAFAACVSATSVDELRTTLRTQLVTYHAEHQIDLIPCLWARLFVASQVELPSGSEFGDTYIALAEQAVQNSDPDGWEKALTHYEEAVLTHTCTAHFQQKFLSSFKSFISRYGLQKNPVVARIYESHGDTLKNAGQLQLAASSYLRAYDASMQHDDIYRLQTKLKDHYSDMADCAFGNEKFDEARTFFEISLHYELDPAPARVMTKRQAFLKHYQTALVTTLSSQAFHVLVQSFGTFAKTTGSSLNKDVRATYLLFVEHAKKTEPGHVTAELLEASLPFSTPNEALETKTQIERIYTDLAEHAFAAGNLTQAIDNSELALKFPLNREKDNLFRLMTCSVDLKKHEQVVKTYKWLQSRSLETDEHVKWCFEACTCLGGWDMGITTKHRDTFVVLFTKTVPTLSSPIALRALVKSFSSFLTAFPQVQTARDIGRVYILLGDKAKDLNEKPIACAQYEGSLSYVDDTATQQAVNAKLEEIQQREAHYSLQATQDFDARNFKAAIANIHEAAKYGSVKKCENLTLLVRCYAQLNKHEALIATYERLLVFGDKVPIEARSLYASCQLVLGDRKWQEHESRNKRSASNAVLSIGAKFGLTSSTNDLLVTAMAHYKKAWDVALFVDLPSHVCKNILEKLFAHAEKTKNSQEAVTFILAFAERRLFHATFDKPLVCSEETRRLGTTACRQKATNAESQSQYETAIGYSLMALSLQKQDALLSKPTIELAIQCANQIEHLMHNQGDLSKCLEHIECAIALRGDIRMRFEIVETGLLTKEKVSVACKDKAFVYQGDVLSKLYTLKKECLERLGKPETEIAQATTEAFRYSSANPFGVDALLMMDNPLQFTASDPHSAESLTLLTKDQLAVRKEREKAERSSRKVTV